MSASSPDSESPEGAGYLLSSIGAGWDRAVLGVSAAIMLMALVVLAGWHAHIAAAVQVFAGLVPMQYNSALCFLALGAAGIGLLIRKRPLALAGGLAAALMGAAVMLEYATGKSFGIDTLFFYPWERTLSADPGRMALMTASAFFLSGAALTVLVLRPGAYAIFGIVNSITLSLALTSLLGYAFQITYVISFSLGSQMALHTSLAFFAYGIAMLGYAWAHAERGWDGLPKWSAGIAVALLPVLFVGAGTLFPEQSWRIALVEAFFSIAGVALVALAIRGLATAKVAYKGLLMIAIPLSLLLIFAGLVAHVKRQNESAQAWALHSTEVIGVSRFLLAQVTEAESAVRGYVMTGDEAFVNSYAKSAEPVTRTVSRFQDLVSDNPRQEAHAVRIGQLAADKMLRLSDTVDLLRTGGVLRAEDRIREGSGSTLMARLRAEMGRFSGEEERLGEERRQVLDASWQRLNWLLVSGTAAALLLASILTILFSGGISRRLQRLRDNAISLSEGKQLEAPLVGQDEIAELDRVFHEMAESLDEASRREKANQILKEQTMDVRHTEALIKTGALQSAIFNSANFSSIATDAKGVIQIFNVGAERMLGYTAAEVMNKITPADISDPQEVIARAEALSLELGTPITPGFEALVFKASRGIEDIYELTYIRKDGSRFPAVVSVTALRDPNGAIIGYLLIGTDNTARKQAEEALLKAGALQSAIFNSANFSSIATDAKGVIQIFNVGAERMLGYTAAEVMNKITPADISDPQEVIARAKALSIELGTPITPGFEALVFKASRGIEDIYELTYFRKDGSRFPAVVSVTALRDATDAIIGYLLIGTDNTARKEAEEALLKAGALQSAIFNSANFSSIATDAKGVIQIFNVGAERMLGYAAADVVNKITPADISDPQEVIVRAEALSLELGTPITPGFEALVFKASRGIEDIYELTYFRKDGSRFPAVVSVTALRDDQEAIIGYLLIGTDNTARKEAEEALLKAGALQSAIFNSANFSSIATDAKGVIQIFNVGAEKMLGYAASEVMNKITPADISDPQELIIRARALSAELGTTITPGFEALVFKASRGIEDIYELTYFRKDGSRFPAIVSVTALRDATDAIIGYLLIGTDNTARKEVEAAQAALDQRLRDQQFYTRSLIESNIDALMTTDPQGIISDVNQQMIALTGRTRDELIGAPFKNFFTDPARADAGIKRVLTENKVSNYELTVRAQNGDETVVSYNAATFHNRDRKLQGVFAAARDVTELKRYERTLQEKNIELEHASRMKSEFLATMSHELRTPLNAIIGFSEALKDGLIGQMSDTQQEYIGDIFTSGQHLLSLINDILDLSKVEAGMMALELEAVDLKSLLSNSLTIVREKAAAQRISLELDAADDLGVPQLDTRKTKQIVYNLLSNAVKFSANGGTVKVRARRVSRDSVGSLQGDWPVHGFPLAENEYNEFLEISVTDSGIGISKANMEKLFLPFSQIDSSLARKFEGTGLGLAMVKLLAELHGGTVAVSSAEGKGACFAAWLPLHRSAYATATLPPGSRASLADMTEPKARIALIVEDDDQAAELVRLLLEAEGFTVLRAASAEAAIEMAPKQSLSLITLDLQLPGISGWEFLQKIRDSATLSRVPVVIISSLPVTNLALARGAAAVLEKPFSRAQLKASLTELSLDPSLEHTYTVLIVDDDPKAVEVIAAFLPAPAYAVVRAYGGNEAISLAQRLMPHLILLDLMMPEVSGFDVVAALQANADTARIPVLVVTAKQITSQDRAALHGPNGITIPIVEKAGFNRLGFLTEVRRALQPR